MWSVQGEETAVQMGCNFGSLTQKSYLLVGVCQGRVILTGVLWTENKPSADWSSSETGTLGHCVK